MVVLRERCELGQIVDVNVRRLLFPVVLPKSVVHADGQHSGIPRRLHIHIRIADHRRLRRRGAQLLQDLERAPRIGFLLFETVAAVNGLKKFRQSQPLQYLDAHFCGFVGQNRQEISRQLCEAFGYSGVGRVASSFRSR